MPFIPSRLFMQPIAVKDSFLVITFPFHFSIFLGIVEIVLVLICMRYLLLDVMSLSNKRKVLLQPAWTAHNKMFPIRDCHKNVICVNENKRMNARQQDLITRHYLPTYLFANNFAITWDNFQEEGLCFPPASSTFFTSLILTYSRFLLYQVIHLFI